MCFRWWPMFWKHMAGYRHEGWLWYVTAVLKSGQGRLPWGGDVLAKTQMKRKRQEHPGCVQGSARKAVQWKWSDSEYGRRGQGGERGHVMETHIQERVHVRSSAWRSGTQVAMAAVRQERWQYAGIAGSQFNSYASILPPLQFQVTGAAPCLFDVLLFQNLPFHLREGKHTH